MGYIYQADVYCDDCGDAICARIRAVGNAPEDEMETRSYDSDNFPKPYAPKHEESDVAEHCGVCGQFLFNPLTSAGYRGIQEQLNRTGVTGPYELGKLSQVNKALAQVASWYNFTYWDAEDCADYFQDERKRTPGWYSPEAY